MLCLLGRRSHYFIVLQDKMSKDYTWWHKEKEFLDNSRPLGRPRVGEVWHVKLWINIWCEENGKWWYIRPCLVIKKIGSLYFIIPCTTKGKDNSMFYRKIESIPFITTTWEPLTSYLLISQWRTVDLNRFVRLKWIMSHNEFHETKKLLQGVYF